MGPERGATRRRLPGVEVHALAVALAAHPTAGPRPPGRAFGRVLRPRHRAGHRGPAVVLTTSGTAAAELHPAVVEADLAGVPLIACTADRPPELRDVGAPQTIDQTHLFGRSVRWFADPGVPADATRPSWRPLAVPGGGRGRRRPRRTRTGPSQPALPRAPARRPGRPEQGGPGRPDGVPWHAVVTVIAHPGQGWSRLLVDRGRPRPAHAASSWPGPAAASPTRCSPLPRPSVGRSWPTPVRGSARRPAGRRSRRRHPAVRPVRARPPARHRDSWVSAGSPRWSTRSWPGPSTREPTAWWSTRGAGGPTPSGRRRCSSGAIPPCSAGAGPGRRWHGAPRRPVSRTGRLVGRVAGAEDRAGAAVRAALGDRTGRPAARHADHRAGAGPPPVRPPARPRPP